jgi:hypothetical protein
VQSERSGGRQVEVAHEVLLCKWPLLRGWLDEDRDFLLWLQRFNAALAEFDRMGTLLSDAQFSEALKWRDRTVEASAERKRINAALEARRMRLKRKSKRAAKVFICYRREDSIDSAHRLHDRLAKRFGPGRVFIDVNSIPSGSNFSAFIEEALLSCGALLAVIGENWASANFQEGNSPRQSRLDDPSDFVRIELETAIGLDVPIIPVLIGKTVMPAPTYMPSSLRKLAYLNAARIQAGSDYDSAVNMLINRIDELLRVNTLGKFLSQLRI